MAFLYRHIRLDKNEVFYIGVGTKRNKKQFRSFKSEYNRAYSKKYRNKYWKHIIAKSEYEIEIMLDNLTWEQACKKEIEFIKLYGRIDLGTGTLVNMTEGGEGNNDLSPEIRKKLSEHFKGKPISEEHKKNISKGLKAINFKGKFVKGQQAWNKGIERTDEVKEKLRKANIGKKHSKETLKKMSNSQKGKKRKPLSEETRKKMSKSRKGRIPWNVGLKYTFEERRKCNQEKTL